MIFSDFFSKLFFFRLRLLVPFVLMMTLFEWQILCPLFPLLETLVFTKLIAKSNQLKLFKVCICSFNANRCYRNEWRLFSGTKPGMLSTTCHFDVTEFRN